jgi:hypothetical protein
MWVHDSSGRKTKCLLYPGLLPLGGQGSISFAHCVTLVLKTKCVEGRKEGTKRGREEERKGGRKGRRGEAGREGGREVAKGERKKESRAQVKDW